MGSGAEGQECGSSRRAASPWGGLFSASRKGQVSVWGTLVPLTVFLSVSNTRKGQAFGPAT